jgi:hypothetical protein
MYTERTDEFIVEYISGDSIKEEKIRKPLEEIELMLTPKAKEYDNVFVYDKHHDLKLGYVKGKKTKFTTPFVGTTQQDYNDPND